MSSELTHISLRPVEPGDEPFLFEVYAGTRTDELAFLPWNDAQREAFLKMQFNNQQGSYKMHYPDADHRIILLSERPVGRLIVVRGETEILLTDIALLPEHRNSGIGASLIRDLCAEAASEGLPVRLHVFKSNRAARLYERLGFRVTGENQTHFQMEWRSDAQ
ncbi:MAG TPA: GNAT family N-acetyltransferase [Pyrinomonadaceae bacterium]|jgi:ribosomal protein S18 acetylase RimI-like enzyme|nr:GNAT family N-acetyltransferase [Pyrinomonadaceae bacterium]